MKKIFTLAILALSINAFSQYSDATLDGPWFIHTVPLSPNHDSLLYLVFDGNGKVTDMSGFSDSFIGDYSVSANGAFSGNLIADGDTFPFYGQLSYQHSGTINLTDKDWILSRVTSPGALTDTLSGTLYTQDCGQKNVTIVLNSKG